jgi:amidase
MDAADLAFAGVARQAELVRAGEVSSRELVETHLDRIARLDGKLNAFRIVYGERALAEADQSQSRLRAGDARPLLGVPVAIKDNTDVAGDVTPHGTGAYGEPAREDAEVVKRVRAAGAIVIGKTHVPELCIWPFTESATWGVTRNPWDLERSPGGSSGGSGSAVAAGLAPAALGSDGGGSIRYPAAFCGLFGLKPQRGRISLAPLPEHWHGLSVYGWLTRRVLDTALLLDATAGAAPGDADTPDPPRAPYAEAARRAPGRLRVAVSYALPPGFLTHLGDGPRSAVQDTAELLRSLGHDVRERDVDYGLAPLNMSVRYLRGIHDDAATLVAHPERLERRTRALVRMGRLLGPAAVARARGAEAAVRDRLNAGLADHDVLVTPISTGPAPPLRRWEGRGAIWTLNGVGSLCPFCAPWNVTGQPAASIPAGIGPDGLPRAAQLVGRPGDEATLLSLAAQVEAERAWGQDRPPVA